MCPVNIRPPPKVALSAAFEIQLVVTGRKRAGDYPEPNLVAGAEGRARLLPEAGIGGEHDHLHLARRTTGSADSHHANSHCTGGAAASFYLTGAAADAEVGVAAAAAAAAC